MLCNYNTKEYFKSVTLNKKEFWLQSCEYVVFVRFTWQQNSCIYKLKRNALYIFEFCSLLYIFVSTLDSECFVSFLPSLEYLEIDLIVETFESRSFGEEIRGESELNARTANAAEL